MMTDNQENFPNGDRDYTNILVKTEPPLVVAKYLTGGYGEITIVRDLELAILRGEWLSLIGANGCGKSTLLKLLGHTIDAKKGSIWLDGQLIHQQPARAIAQILSFLPQQPIVPEGLTVWELVSLGRTPHQPWWQWDLNSDDRQHVADAIHLTQLDEYRHRVVATLSGGERQRVFLALALAQEPQILLLDEPTTYLDIGYQLELLDLLAKLNQQKKITIVSVLHEINLAMRYSHRIAIIKEGELLAVGSPESVVTESNLRAAFKIEAAIVDTPVGKQICPLYCTGD
jgi:iron complex transport system ATP-binding protein